MAKSKRLDELCPRPRRAGITGEKDLVFGTPPNPRQVST
jgi:hypothetical protein